jgi:hypothetical protein
MLLKKRQSAVVLGGEDELESWKKKKEDKRARFVRREDPLPA